MALAACEEEKVDASAFPDVQSCVAAAKEGSLWFTETDCQAQFAAAQQEYLETAPRYESKALCEQEHGVGNCGDDPVAAEAGTDASAQQSGGGFSFMPLLMGYMMGSMLSRGGGMLSQPMVKGKDGSFTTPKGEQSFRSNNGSAKVSGNTFNRAPSTIGKPPMTSTQVSQRGGFGRSATSTGSSRFGG